MHYIYLNVFSMIRTIAHTKSRNIGMLMTKNCWKQHTFTKAMHTDRKQHGVIFIVVKLFVCIKIFIFLTDTISIWNLKKTGYKCRNMSSLTVFVISQKMPLVIIRFENWTPIILLRKKRYCCIARHLVVLTKITAI